MVQQLVEEFEYDLESSIDAIRLCGGDLARAMNYLETRDANNGDELFAEIKPVDVIVGVNTDAGYVMLLVVLLLQSWKPSRIYLKYYSCSGVAALF